MSDLRLSSILASIASSAADAVDLIKDTDGKVSLEEFEVGFEFEGRFDFDRVAEVQDLISRRQEGFRAFRGVSLLDYRTATPVKTPRRSLFASLFRRRDDEPSTSTNKVTVRIVISSVD